LARELVDQGAAAPPRNDDPMLHEAVRFLRQHYSADASKQAHWSNSRSAISQAFEIAMTGDYPCTRLQARLLTGEPLVETATHVDLPLATVEAYENLFFSVRDRLRARDFIVRRALGWVPGSDPSEEAITRAFAYFGGPVVLDLILEVFGQANTAPIDAVLATKEGRIRLQARLAQLPQRLT
jgi:hypothetical protein